MFVPSPLSERTIQGDERATIVSSHVSEASFSGAVAAGVVRCLTGGRDESDVVE